MTDLFYRLTTEPDTDISPADKLPERSKAQQARLNSQKSTGPTTPEGKAISALNARRHGYAGASIVIADEDRDAYNAHLHSYYASFAPQTQPERDTIRRAAVATWRSDRLASIEVGIMDIELNHATPTIDVALTDYDLNHKLAYSFMQQTETQGQTALALCMRYLTAATRDFDRAIRSFYLMKENRLSDAERLQVETESETEQQTPAIHLVKTPEEPPTPNEPTPTAPSAVRIATKRTANRLKSRS